MSQTETVVTPQATTNSSGRRVLGWVLLFPAFVGLLLSLVWPTIQTITLSLSRGNPLRSNASQLVGTANFTNFFSDPIFWEALQFTLGLISIRLMIVLVVPVFLALVVSQFGRRVQLPMRLLFTIPLAFFAPTALAISWMLATNSQFGHDWLNGSGQSVWANAERARSTLLFADSVMTFGIATGLGLIVYLMAWRGAADPQSAVRRPLLLAWFAMIIATIAISCQSFSFSFVLTGGGPARATTTLGLLVYNRGFTQFNFGEGATIAVLLLAVAGVCGLLVVGLLAGLRVQLQFVARHSASKASGPRTEWLIGLGLVGVISLVGLGLWLMPLSHMFNLSLQSQATLLDGEAGGLTGAAYAEALQRFPLVRAYLNTLVPPMLSVGMQLVLAYLGALGIGVFRPLGRASAWLLLPFAPWLFVGSLPLLFNRFTFLRDAGWLDSFAALIPPVGVNVVMLVVLTLFFLGQHERLEQARASGQAASFAQYVVLPSLPLGALLGCVAWFVAINDFVYQFVVVNSAELATLGTQLVTILRLLANDPALIAATTILYWLPVALVMFLILALFQAFYLERLVLVRPR
jgi:ABC-type sugar transport system permease subunit